MGVLPPRVCKLQGKHGDHRRQRQLTCSGCRCLVEELKKNLQKSNPGVQAVDLTEVTLIAAVKKLAVREESKLAHRIMVFLFLEQPRSTRIHEQGEGGQ